MRLEALVVLGTAAWSGCKQSREHAEPAAGSPAPITPHASVAPVAQAAPAGEILVDLVDLSVDPIAFRKIPLRVDASALARLLPARPALPVPFAAINFARPATELDGKLPADVLKSGKWVPPTFDGVVLELTVVIETDASTDVATRYITAAKVLLPRATARELVTARWGPPADVRSSKGVARHVWTDPAAGLQAFLADDTNEDPRVVDLVIRDYVPLDRLVGDLTDRFAFEPRSVLGLTVPDALAIIPVELRARTSSSGASLRLPPLDFEDDDEQVRLEAEDGKITAVSVYVPKTADYAAKAMALVAKKGPRFHFVPEAGDASIIVERL